MQRPTCIILCGVPGSGKSTYAQNYIKQFGGIHLSSDTIRKELYGDESIQGNPNEIFSLMEQRAVNALNQNINVIYDSTGITRKDRAGIIAACPQFVKIEVHVIWAPIEMCIERDASRERTVGEAVIDRMLKRFQPPYYDEGIGEIKIIWPDQFDPYEYDKNIWKLIKVPHDNPHHTLDINEHCLDACAFAYNHNYSESIEYAALWHDIGKGYTKSFVDSKGNSCETAHYYSHQNYGAWISYGLPRITPFIAWLIGAHMEPFGNTKYYNRLPNYLKLAVDQLHECDLAAH